MSTNHEIFVGLRAKAYSYLKDKNNEDQKAKGTKKCVIKRKLKFKDDKNCSEATQLENKISNQEKYETDVDIVKKDHKKFM